MLTFGSVCSGIGGAELVFEGLAEPIFMAEENTFAQRVLRTRFPDTRLLPDMLDLIEQPHPVDILVGGCPCQAFSLAGKRLSLEDARGNLTLALTMVLDSIDAMNASLGLLPAVLLYENVPGLLSTKDNALGCFLGALVGATGPIKHPGSKRAWPRAGVVSGPTRSAAWRIQDAQWHGLAQRRKRVFVVASAREGFDPFKVLFESEGVQRHIAPSREAGEKTAVTLAGSTTGSGGRWTAAEQVDNLIAYGGNRTSGPLDVATARNAHKGPHGRLDFETDTFLVQDPIAFNSREDCVSGPVPGALGTSSPQAQAIAYMPARTFGKDGGIDERFAERPVCDALHTGSGGGGNKSPVILYQSRVRRLTPLECERLQGFPDGWTKLDERTADGPRYKAIGNAFAINAVRWIAKRLVKEISK
jgi:DNA (cytosine-5)-methyltransferase 1